MVRAQVGMAISELPEDMTPLRQLKRVYDQRREMVESGKGIDWGFAEALAFGTLLSEGACCCAAQSALQQSLASSTSCACPLASTSEGGLDTGLGG